MNIISAYKENAVATQSRIGIVVKLYEGAIKFLRQATVAMENGDMAQKGILITKASEIIGELNLALDMEVGGEIAQNLRSLYNFMLRHLSQANFRKDPQAIREVIAMLTELNEGWTAISNGER